MQVRQRHPPTILRGLGRGPRNAALVGHLLRDVVLPGDRHRDVDDLLHNLRPSMKGGGCCGRPLCKERVGYY